MCNNIAFYLIFLIFSGDQNTYIMYRLLTKEIKERGFHPEIWFVGPVKYRKEIVAYVCHSLLFVCNDIALCIEISERKSVSLQIEWERHVHEHQEYTLLKRCSRHELCALKDITKSNKTKTLSLGSPRFWSILVWKVMEYCNRKSQDNALEGIGKRNPCLLSENKGPRQPWKEKDIKHSITQLLRYFGLWYYRSKFRYNIVPFSEKYQWTTHIVHDDSKNIICIYGHDTKSIVGFDMYRSARYKSIMRFDTCRFGRY